MIGQTISHYQILEKLGEGGMGVVYKARDTKLDRDVALKFLPAHLSASTEEKARFLQEARAAASLSHPNICTIFAIEESREPGSQDPRYFFAMELVEGTTIRRAMPGLPLQRALDIGSQVAEGLAAAHDRGIVHRDVKAENIMLRPDGRAQIMDFGLARVGEGSQLTKAGSTVGTIGYMSPEQIQGMEVDHRADIFSLGVLLYEMAAGRLPFRGGHDAAVMYEIVNVQPPDPAAEAPEVPAELGRIIMKCLAKDREERYQSARDIAVDLKILRKRSGSGIVATRPPSPSGSGPVRGTPPAAAKRRTPLVAILVAAAVIVGAAATWYLTRGGTTTTISSMVVLPFENAGNDPDLEYLSDGLTEGIINKLTALRDVRVLPRSASFRYKGSKEDPAAIGKQLGADAVLSGRVVQRGDRLDLTVELVDVREYAQLWGDSYNRSMADLMTLQNEIVDGVTKEVRPVSAASGPSRAKLESKNPAAYQLYLQGRYYWNKRTAADIDRAIDFFSRAIGLDPEFARAHLALAESYILQPSYSNVVPGKVFPLAAEHATRALEIDNSLGEAHASLAQVRMESLDWEGAEREYRLAIETSPGYPTAYHWYRIFLTQQGRHAEALSAIRKAVELDPTSPIILANLMEEYMLQKDFPAAARICRSMEAMELTSSYFRSFFAAIALETGDTAKALQITNTLSDDGSPYVFARIVFLYARAGARAKADSVFRAFKERDRAERFDPLAVTTAYAGYRDWDRVFETLNGALADQGWKRSLGGTRTLYEFNEIRDDPRYLRILNAIGLK